MSTKKTKWFTRHKTFYVIPMNPAGWTVMICYVALNAFYYVQVKQLGGTISATLFNYFWFFIVSTIVLYLIVINKE